ncbi:hypothetical protein EMPS_06733 [Entomortierella parvispora]|uniref:JmjC domain-containing histone demethylation protein 1 n=1 Tax=Entomortierella parvispora TaxID=205924 RepID=A0A9P3HD67_9FUNG|nr:hypothetical protein EMPS_06733 [Entomortierella parvispora]
MTDEQDRCSLCPEQIKTGAAMTWICCDVCETWYHVRCLGMSIEEFEVIDRYHCQSCIPSAGPSTLLRKSSRKQGKINYADLVNGVVSHQSKWRVLLESNQFLPDKFERIEKAEDLTLDWLRQTGFKAPIIVPSGASRSTIKGEHSSRSPSSMEGLDMKMPPSSLTVDDVRDLVGPETPVEVMDVATQSELLDWNMRDWADYFKTEPKERVYNVISLEITGTDLAKQVQRPRIVRELDWVQNFWPESLSPTEFPKVQLYCLMSVKESFTDFHIDFAGSSVFYHILSGAKTFYFVEPTSTHLRKYAKWSSSADQSTTFFGDEVAGKCYKVDLQQGDTMFIPAGWIHAVYTPLSSVVIGGNFIHSLHVPMQYRVATIEIETNVPPKFRFPFFEKLNWFVALGCWERGHPYLATLSNTELYGIMSVTMHLYTRQQQLTGGSSKTESRKSAMAAGPVSKEERHLIRASVPAEVASFDQGGPLGLLRLLNSEVKSILESRAMEKVKQGVSSDTLATLPDSLKNLVLPTPEQEMASRSSSRSSNRRDGTGSEQDTSASESTELAKETTPKLKLKLNLKSKAMATKQPSSSGDEEGESSHGEQQVPGSTTKKILGGVTAITAEEKGSAPSLTPKPKLKLKLSTVMPPQSTQSSSQSANKRTRRASQKKKAALEDERVSAAEMDQPEDLTSDDEWDAFESQLENDLDSADSDDGELEPGTSDSEYEGSAPKRASSSSGSKARKRLGSSAGQGSTSMTYASENRVKVAPSEVFFDEDDDFLMDQDELQETTKKQKVDPGAPATKEIRSLGGLAASTPLSRAPSSNSNKKKVNGSTAKDRIKNLLMKRR